MSMTKKKEMKKIVLGSVMAVAATTMIFNGASQTVKAFEIGKTQVVETSYNMLANGTTNGHVPVDYEKRDYEVKLVGKDQPSVNDMKKEEAAELASQKLWEVFRVDLSGQALEMSYMPASKVQQRATWEASVKIHDNLSYDFIVDAVTGESHWIGKSVYHKKDIPVGFDKNLLENHEEYQEIVKALVEEHQLLLNKVTAVDYISQGYDTNEIDNKNPNITFEVTSENGEKVQLTISTYNKELLSVGYDRWLKETERFERQLNEELNEDARTISITDQLIKEVEETGLPITINE